MISYWNKKLQMCVILVVKIKSQVSNHCFFNTTYYWHHSKPTLKQNIYFPLLDFFTMFHKCCSKQRIWTSWFISTKIGHLTCGLVVRPYICMWSGIRFDNRVGSWIPWWQNWSQYFIWLKWSFSFFFPIWKWLIINGHVHVMFIAR